MGKIRVYSFDKGKAMKEAAEKGTAGLRFVNGDRHRLTPEGQHLREIPKDRSMSPRQLKKLRRENRMVCVSAGHDVTKPLTFCPVCGGGAVGKVPVCATCWEKVTQADRDLFAALYRDAGGFADTGAWRSKAESIIANLKKEHDPN